MSKRYRPYEPEQGLLWAPSLRDWLPEDHLAYFVSDLVEDLDLSAIYAQYEGDLRGPLPKGATRPAVFPARLGKGESRVGLGVCDAQHFEAVPSLLWIRERTRKWGGRKKENLPTTCAPAGVTRLLSPTLPRPTISICARRVFSVT
jgi:hypothetical protein